MRGGASARVFVTTSVLRYTYPQSVLMLCSHHAARQTHHHHHHATTQGLIELGSKPPTNPPARAIPRTSPTPNPTTQQSLAGPSTTCGVNNKSPVGATLAQAKIAHKCERGQALHVQQKMPGRREVLADFCSNIVLSSIH